MSHTTATALRDNMASYFDRVTEDHEPLVVTRSAGKGSVVVMAEDDFAGWQETVHLLSSPRNAERMLRAKKQLDAGGGKVRQLVRS
jgi:antitoxin YefM